MASWDIMINDEQRKALMLALFASGVGSDNNENDPLQYWIKMLNDLPKEDPGDWSKTFECRPGERKRMLHGFCL